jgi:hypothetical protein
MKPRYASAVVATKPFVQQVFACDEDEWRRLPVQWRGFVLFNQNRQYTARTMLGILAKGHCSTAYDPQGVFDAYQGLAPA